MAWYLRKALRLGPLRLNLSKRGVGLSGGAKGGRLGLDASGRPYIHGGRGGLYYRRRFGRGHGASQSRLETVLFVVGIAFAVVAAWLVVSALL